ncbi:MAG TPA: hypothetical protein VFC21_12025 [Bryobacteraceae bacterium]|nr:hypothetical protein [Bryobacteraceae bacterium]
MRRIIAVALLLGAMAWAGDKRLPSGDAGNDTVQASGTVLDSEQLQQTFGSDFGNMFTVIEMTLIPRGGNKVEVHLDDFLLRSSQTGDHSGPFAPAQIAGQGTLVVHQNGDRTGKSRGGLMGGLGGIMMGGGGMGTAEPPPEAKTEIKNSEKKDPMLDLLKRKILAEKAVGEPVTGLLFFPLEKEKPKNLELIYTTPSGKLRMKFK